jgi:hypothetical protein
MAIWIEKTPYVAYGDYNDKLNDKQAQMLINGNFEAFDESWFQVERHVSDYAEWSYWEKEFVEFFYPDIDVEYGDLPQGIQDLVCETRYIDCSDLLRTCCRNWRGHVVARLKKRNGDHIEFPTSYHDKTESRAMQHYLKTTCGIDGWKAEATYTETYLCVLGSVDLWELYQKQQKPEFIQISENNCFTIGVDSMNGSGTGGPDQYKGKKRVMSALFFVDGQRGYGVDDIFGLTGECWQNELNIVYKAKT